MIARRNEILREVDEAVSLILEARPNFTVLLAHETQPLMQKITYESNLQEMTGEASDELPGMLLSLAAQAQALLIINGNEGL